MKKVNLVLSGGAARGVAHIGVLKALEDLGFHVEALSGASAGALVSVFYAWGYSPEDMIKIVLETNWLKLLRPRISSISRGLIPAEPLMRELHRFVPCERIEELPKRVFVCVTDLFEGKALYLSEGNLQRAVIGSCALPGIFEPVEWNGKVLVDGGVANNLPVEPFQDSNIPCICVDVNPLGKMRSSVNLISVLVRSLFIAVRSNVESRKRMCDVVLSPPVESISPFEIGRARELFEIGYESALASLKRL